MNFPVVFEKQVDRVFCR